MGHKDLNFEELCFLSYNKTVVEFHITNEYIMTSKKLLNELTIYTQTIGAYFDRKMNAVVNIQMLYEYLIAPPKRLNSMVLLTFPAIHIKIYAFNATKKI